MQDLQRALDEIAQIRGQMARGTVFRGYGPAALAATGALAGLAALAQAAWIDDPVRDIAGYLAIWVATAVVSVAVVGTEAVRRARRVHSGLADDMIRAAAEQFLPAAIAGALVTVVIRHTAAEALWMLPGLWQVVFSLGVFASCRSLPRPMVAIAVWYLATGLACLAMANGENALSPWAMGVPFGAGQVLAAVLLKWNDGSRDDED
jgi:hypothetical protein